MKNRKLPHSCRRTALLVAAFCLSLAINAALQVAYSQSVSSFDRERARTMLDAVKGDIKKNYYDPTFHGLDLEASFKAADEKIKQATTNSQIFGTVAQLLVEFEDSHTFFLPPSRVARTDYGWQMEMIGDKCYVKAVKPSSDAEAKGLHTGDEILGIDGFTPTRADLWKIKYFYYTLSPRTGMHLVVRKPDGKAGEIDVMAKVQSGKKVTDLTGDDIWDVIREAETEDRLNRHRYY